MDTPQASTSAVARACPSCGAKAPTPEARFCLSCGKPLPAQEAEQPARAAVTVVQQTEESRPVDAVARGVNVTTCPRCKMLMVPDKGHCPGCGAEAPMTAPTPVTSVPDLRGAMRRGPANMLHCPICGEYVMLEDGKCPLCDAQVTAPTSRASARTGTPTTGGMQASDPSSQESRALYDNGVSSTGGPRPSASSSVGFPSKQCRHCGAWNTADSYACRNCRRIFDSGYSLGSSDQPVGAHWVSLLAGAAAMIGSLLPWYSVTDSATGTSTSFNGFSTGGMLLINYGWYPLMIGGVIVVLEWIALASGKAGRGHWTAALALAGVTAAALASELQNLTTVAGNSSGSSVSFGPYLALIAAIVIGIAAVTGLLGEE
ncbi:MAG: hypothetical protein ACRDGS_04425 [Chloroflexota bacterium]